MHVNTTSELLYILMGYACENNVVYLPEYSEEDSLKGLVFHDYLGHDITISFDNQYFIDVELCENSMTFKLDYICFDLKPFEHGGKMQLRFILNGVNFINIMLYDYEF